MKGFIITAICLIVSKSEYRTASSFVSLPSFARVQGAVESIYLFAALISCQIVFKALSNASSSMWPAKSMETFSAVLINPLVRSPVSLSPGTGEMIPSLYFSSMPSDRCRRLPRSLARSELMRPTRAE